MATITATETATGLVGNRIITWSPLDGSVLNEAGTPVRVDDAFDLTVATDVTTASTGTMVLEGSHDGTNWGTLQTPTGGALSALTITANPATQSMHPWMVVGSRPIYIRPRVTVAGGIGVVAVHLHVRARN